MCMQVVHGRGLLASRPLLALALRCGQSLHSPLDLVPHNMYALGLPGTLVRTSLCIHCPLQFPEPCTQGSCSSLPRMLRMHALCRRGQCPTLTLRRMS